jgi:hypothetical protein
VLHRFSMKRPVWSLALAAGLGAFVTIGGCNRDKPAAKEEPSASEPAPQSPVSAVDATNYHVGLAPVGLCQHQQPCQLHAVVVAKGDYHINDKYPYRFTAEDAPGQGLSFPKREIGRADGEFEQQKAILKVPFSAERAGEAKVGGRLSFSVCSEKNCLMYTQPLALLVRVD